MTIEVLAPAKLNLALEITGRRPDGYHDLVSVMQTIDLCDRVRVSEAAVLELSVEGEALRGVPQRGWNSRVNRIDDVAPSARVTCTSKRSVSGGSTSTVPT